MREIKFRVFDQISKQMSPSFSLFGEFTMIGGVFAWLDGVRGHEYNTGLLSLNDLDVMQFTGLKDANGICIYEGDILQDEEYYLSKVYWDEEDHMWACTDVGGLCDICASIEVIGNIHQNPELLEK